MVYCEWPAARSSEMATTNDDAGLRLLSRNGPCVVDVASEVESQSASIARR